MGNGDFHLRILPCPMIMAISITISIPPTSNHFFNPIEEPKEVIDQTSTKMMKQIKPSLNSPNKLPNYLPTTNIANI